MDNGIESSSDSDYELTSPNLSSRQWPPERNEELEFGEVDPWEEVRTLERVNDELHKEHRFLESMCITGEKIILDADRGLAKYEQDLRDRDRTIKIQNKKIRKMELMLQERARATKRKSQKASKNPGNFNIRTSGGVMAATAAAASTNSGLMGTPSTFNTCRWSANIGGPDPVGVGSAATGIRIAASTVTTGRAGGVPYNMRPAGTEARIAPATVAGTGFGGASSTMTSAGRGSGSGGISSTLGTSGTGIGGARNKGVWTTSTAPISNEIMAYVIHQVATGNRIVSSTVTSAGRGVGQADTTVTNTVSVPTSKEDEKEK